MFRLSHPERLGAVAGALDESERVVLTCHVRPDGDAVGSMLGMAAALENAGKEVICYCQDEPPGNLSFLPGFERLVHTPPLPFPEGSALLVLDCSEADRIGEHGARMVDEAHRLIVIDHHLGQDMCGGSDTSEKQSDARSDDFCVQYIDPDIFATGALCFAVLSQLEWNVTPEIATNFYTAILTDTGCFRHSNTTALAFDMAARLVEMGADPYDISDRIFERVPFRKLALLNLALDTLSLDLQGRVAMLHITRSMQEQAGASVQDSDDFVRYARCIDGVEVSAFIKEISDELVSVSLRSRSWFNVAAVAKSLGGGGHFHAAGFRAKGDAPLWRQRLVGMLQPIFEQREHKSSMAAQEAAG